MKTKSLIDYMKQRAKFENTGWELPDSYIENLFVQKGTRIFFGVVLDDLGIILRDDQQPEFYEKYKNEKI